MTCREFNANLNEYIDETLESGLQAAAHEHVAICPECRLVLQRAQTFAGAVQDALKRKAAPVSLSPDARRRILRAAQPAPAETAAVRAWAWLAATPLRTLVAGATLVAAFLLTVEFDRRSQTPAPMNRGPALYPLSFSIDVPFPSGDQVGMSHAEFFEPPEPLP